MIYRGNHSELDILLEEFPAVGILGSRQVGKTTLAKQVGSRTPSIYIDLELPDDLVKLSNPSLFFKTYQDHLIILDEIQVKPELFPILRAVIDQDRRPGRFLILGSASPVMMRNTAESLAGRIAYIDLPPLLLSEIDVENQNILWLRGGFPLSYLAKSEAASLRWRQSYIRSYVEKDLSLLGLPNNPEFLRRFWTMAAHLNGKLANYADIGRSLQVTSPTIREYYDLFGYTFLIYEVTPYFGNLKKRLVKSPRYYISDTGVLHSLLGIKSFEDLLGHPHAGHSWESFVMHQIKHHLPEEHSLSFYRTHQGAEIDALILKSGKPYISCEIKMGNAPKISKGMKIAIQDVETELNFIITHSSDRYPIDEHIEVINIHDFIFQILKTL